MEQREVYSSRSPDDLPSIRIGERSARLQSFLERLDFKALGALFAEHARKSGRTGEVNFLGSDHIFDSAIPRNLYIPSENAIGLHLNSGGGGADHNFINMVQSLCHEETHAVTDSSHYHEYVMGYDRNSKLLLFNEGVTEKFSRELAEEYLQARGELKRGNNDAGVVYEYYRTEVAFVDYVIGRLAEKAGLPERAVWEAMVSGMFTNEQLDDEELVQLFDQAFSNDFMGILAGAKESEELQDLMSVDWDSLASRLVHKLKLVRQKLQSS